MRITQSFEWRGPIEWAAPAGRLAAREPRTLVIGSASNMHVIDVESRLASADWDFTLGPTRHAYFNVRVADSMVVALGGLVQDDAGRIGGEAITDTKSRWVDFSGPVGGGRTAGLAVFPDQRDHEDLSWFVADWGVVTVGPFRLKGRLVSQGHGLVARYRVVVHDGSAAEAGVGREFERFLEGGGCGGVELGALTVLPERTDRRERLLCCGRWGEKPMAKASVTPLHATESDSSRCGRHPTP